MISSAPDATRLIAPPLALASCVRAYITRSTVAAPLAHAADRFNHYPATPFCSIAWHLEGTAELVEPAQESEPMRASSSGAASTCSDNPARPGPSACSR